MNKEEMQRLAQRLEQIEPDLPAMAEEQVFGASNHLVELLTDSSERVRANALSALSLVDTEAFVDALPRAAADESRIVRMQAAICMQNVSPDALGPVHETAIALLRDSDPGVRKFALKSAAVIAAPAVQAMVDRIRDHDPESHLRALANDISNAR